MTISRRFIPVFAILLVACSGGENDDDFASPGEDAGPDATDTTDASTDTDAAAPMCGDGTVDEGEECDGTALDEQSCLTRGFEGGELACNMDCTFDETDCANLPDTCGDGMIDDGEECDGGELGGQTCGDAGFVAGVLGCTDSCTLDTSGCSDASICGDGEQTGGEECDDGNETDEDGCDQYCVLEECGDGIVQTGLGEECDSGAVVATCEDFPGQPVGIQQCSSACLFETLVCPDPAECGDGEVDLGESCDDGNTDDGDGCDATCQSEACGDGVLQGGEACDGEILGRLDCSDFGFSAGDIACGSNCSADVSGCFNAECGNGNVEGFEQCDDGNRTDGDGCDRRCRTEDEMCADGFERVDGECVDIDECAGDHGCDELAGCSNLEGSFECGACPAGYIDANGDGTLCEDIDECAFDPAPCDVLVACNNAPGTYSCDPCPIGYDDVNADGTLCEDIDECVAGTSGCDPLAGCTNDVGTFSCGECPSGYADTNGDGTLCEDIDECLTDMTCDPLAGCVNEPGAFSCGACPAGYDDANDDGTLCEDIDECLLGRCDPLVTCSNSVGSYACGPCPAGYLDSDGTGAVCDPLWATPPTGSRQCYLWGDPHIRTFDGLAFDVQGAGEFVMARDSDLEIQVRQEPVVGSLIRSKTTAVALDAGASRVGVYLGEDPPIRIDGASTAVDEVGVDLGGASVHYAGDTVIIVLSATEQVRVTIGADGLDVAVFIDPGRAGTTRGLCGDNNGDPVEDIILPDDSVLIPPIAIDVLYDQFIHGWAVGTDTLFDYPPDTTTDDYVDLLFPDEFLDAGDLTDDVTVLEQACIDGGVINEYVIEACVWDAYYGDPMTAIEAALRVQDPELILPLERPILFHRWQQEGRLSNGNWAVAVDRRSVRQTINNEPTFFVSPVEFQDVLITGTLRVEQTGDDDFIGFVFGYQGPLAENGDPVDSADFYIFDWKQQNQAPAEEGMQLSRIFSTNVPVSDYWDRENSAHRTILADDRRTTNGWVDNTTHEFTLLFREDRIDITVDGTLVFRERGSFQNGRFGFYNYSQANVRYAGFSATALDALTLCGDGVLDTEEICDDGNTMDGDGCSSTCDVELCADGMTPYTVYYEDADMDDWGNFWGPTAVSCTGAPAGFAPIGDCDESDPAVSPDAVESCVDEVDNDCNPATTCGPFCADNLPTMMECSALAPTLPEPLVYYTFDAADRMDATIFDVSMTAFDGTTSGGVTFEPSDIGGDGIVLDGASGRVSGADPPKPTTLTFAAWVRPASVPTDRSHPFLQLGNGPTGWTGVGLGIQTNGTLSVTNEGGTSALETGLTTVAPVCVDRWTHIVATFDGADLRIYRNGVLDNQVASAATTIAWGTNGLELGRHTQFMDHYFDGALDEVVVWDTVLDDTEILSLFELGACGMGLPPGGGL